ncbi:MAG TPA: sodium transporter, partial [Anseongella sp.]
VPTGVKGIALAALVAAAASSLSAMVNSVSTIFTMDIYKDVFKKNATERQLVTTGRITAAIAFIIAIVLAPQIEHLGSGGFQFIQKFTGYVSPGILCIFLFGLFWKKTTTRAALTVAIVLLPLSIVVDKLLFPAMPFMNQMGLCFLVLSALTIGISLAKPEDNTGKIIEFHRGFFRTDRVFNVAAIGVIALLIILYTVFY